MTQLITLAYSEIHRTRDGRHGLYCTIREATTGRLAGRFQLVFLPGGEELYRSFEGEAFAVATRDEAILEAMRRHRERPRRLPARRSQPQRGGYRGRRPRYDIRPLPKPARSEHIETARDLFRRRLRDRIAS